MAVGSAAEALGAQAFLRELGADETNVDLMAAVIAWFRQESGSVGAVIGNNPFNIRPGAMSYLASGTRTTKSIGNFLIFPDLATGFQAAAALLKKLSPSYGYGEVIKYALRSDAVSFLAALAMSSWDVAHYGVTVSGQNAWYNASTTQNHLLRVYAALTGIMMPDAAFIAKSKKLALAPAPALQGPFAHTAALLPWTVQLPHGVTVTQRHGSYPEARQMGEFYRAKHPMKGTT